MDKLLPLTALLLKGQSDCEISAAKIWPPTRTPVRDCIRPYFSERLNVREYESDAKIQPDRRLELAVIMLGEISFLSLLRHKGLT